MTAAAAAAWLDWLTKDTKEFGKVTSVAFLALSFGELLLGAISFGYEIQMWGSSSNTSPSLWEL